MPDLAPGLIIGHYRLVRQIGEGGMGEVYLAERATDFSKRAAIKVIRSELARSELLRKFAIERQTLAALSHPSIVGLLDGGTTEDGRPYLVTEFVEGVPIDRYCEERALDVSGRLKLFLKVCAAVHYAHQSLVVHCDLKPANVLVTKEGAPMLLDFGIAKLLDPAAMGVTMQLGDSRAGFTPQYASPEQLLGLPVTTATDTYALGVILYELLTGQMPFALSESMAGWIKSVCESDAEAPSERIRRDPRTGSRGVDRTGYGDLDAIVLKALRKDPRDRYASVDQFAEDIRRHMDGRPVIARKNTTAYLVRKFLTRHKVAVAAAAVVLVAIAGGGVSTWWQARIAARRFEDVRRLAHTFLFEVHDSIRNLPGSTPARSLIAGTGTEYLDRLARDARGDFGLQMEVAEGYLKIGDVQGNPFEANLGDTAKAIENYRKALGVAESAGARNSQARAVLARIHENLASVLPFDGKASEGLEHARQAVALYGEVAQSRPADVESKLDLARGFETQGDLEGGARGINLGRTADAQHSYEQSLVLIPQLPSGHASFARAERARAVILLKLADMQSRTGNLSAALTQYESSLETAEKLAAADRNNTRAGNLVSTVLNRLAATQMSAGQNREAAETFRRALTLDEAALSADPNNERARSGMIVTEKNLGDLYYYNLNDFPQALRAYSRVAELLEAQLRGDPQNVVWKQNLSETLTYIASSLVELKRPAEARREAQRGLALAKQIADRPGATHDQVYNYAWLGITIEPDDLRDARAVLPYARKAVETDASDALSLHVLAQAYAGLGDFARAVETEERALALFSAPQAGKPVSAQRSTVEKFLAEYRAALNKTTGRAVEPSAVPVVAAAAPSAAPIARPTPKPFLLDDWLATPGWTRDGGMLKHQGGDFVLAPPDFAEATVQFTVSALRGKRIEWVLRYRDADDYCLISIDDNVLTRYQIAAGARSPVSSVTHKLKKGAFQIRIGATASGIVHSVFREGAWQVLDTWHPQGAPQGRFGFHIAGRDQIGLSEFSLAAN